MEYQVRDWYRDTREWIWMDGYGQRALSLNVPELLGFAPDLDPRTPGVITAGDGFIPTIRGVAGAPTPSDMGVPVLTGDLPCLGAATIRNLSGTRRTIAGTASSLLELIGNAWVDRTRASGPYHTGGGRWRYTQFGDPTIATNRIDQMQSSLPGTAFSDLAGSPPRARFIDTVGLFAIAADTNEPVFGDQPDRWWCSGLGNAMTWVPSISTQSASGRILDSDGPITASRGLGNSWILYKQDAIYVRTYVGGDVIWSFERVPGNIGCVSHDSIVNLQSRISSGDGTTSSFLTGTGPNPSGVTSRSSSRVTHLDPSARA